MIFFKTIIWAAKVRISEQITKRFLSFFERKQKQRRTQHLLGPPNNVTQISQKSQKLFYYYLSVSVDVNSLGTRL